VQAALHEPFVVDGLSLHVEASLGVVTSARHGRDPERLLRAADVAMYAAKSTSSGIAEYEPELDYSTAGRLALLSDLRRALDVDTELHLHYQPQVDLAFGQLIWSHHLSRACERRSSGVASRVRDWGARRWRDGTGEGPAERRSCQADMRGLGTSRPVIRRGSAV
jgi:predicted signal transduction protein with EAL and GGDEF domain